MIKAEAEAHMGNWQEGLTTLETLRVKRIETAGYRMLTAANREDALRLILKEHRLKRTFAFTWYDAKRYNAYFTLLKLNASVIIPENKKINFGLLYYINYICRKYALIAKIMKITDHRETEIMSRFNRKDAVAFSDVYDLLYKPLYYFAFNLYKDTPVDANDVIHDAFIMIWEHKKLSFENYTSLKTFLYITIKNRFRNHLVHQKCEIKYSESVKKTYAERSLTSEIVEVETLSIIQEALKILPEECAKVFELHVNGWSVKEIAEKLGKSQCTVYTQRQDAITILKKKMSKGQMYIILLLIS